MGRDPSNTEKQLKVSSTAKYLRNLLNIKPTDASIKAVRNTVMLNKKLKGDAKKRKDAANKRADEVKSLRARKR